jgi:hypothetical protein
MMVAVVSLSKLNVDLAQGIQAVLLDMGVAHEVAFTLVLHKEGHTTYCGNGDPEQERMRLQHLLSSWDTVVVQDVPGPLDKPI